jgi:hypothetical protein
VCIGLSSVAKNLLCAMAVQLQFNPTEGITLHVHGDKICIKGRNLNAEIRPEVRLFQGIARHRVAWVQEADRPGGLNGGKRTTIIDQIVW